MLLIRSSLRADDSINSCSVYKNLPGASSIFPTVVSFLERSASSPLPIPIIPTFATSPSRRAFVACVVPCAIKITSSGEIEFCVRISSIA